MTDYYPSHPMTRSGSSRTPSSLAAFDRTADGRARVRDFQSLPSWDFVAHHRFLTSSQAEALYQLWLSNRTTPVYLVWPEPRLKSNLLLYPEQFDAASWVKIRTTVTPNAATAPDGTLTADKIVCDGTADPQLAQNVYASAIDGRPLAGRTFNFSVWAWTDAGQPTDGMIMLRDTDWVSKAQPAITYGTTPTRYSVSLTMAAGVTSAFVQARIDPPHAPAAGNYVYYWGAQLVESPAIGEYVNNGASMIKTLDRYAALFTAPPEIREESNGLWSATCRLSGELA